MSGILGIFLRTGETPSEAVVRRMAAGMARRGADRLTLWRSEGVALAVSRADWEMERGFSGDEMLATDGDLVVVADASVYYRADLRRALDAAGLRVEGDAPGALIAAAYRAWGEACAERIEGEWAFVIWDRKQRTALCSRDFVGSRPLFFADTRDALLVGSTIDSILAYPKVPRDLNLVSVAEAAAGLFAPAQETCYRAISRLPAGWSMVWDATRGTRMRRSWEPPAQRDSTAPTDAAAEELHELLCSAVAERMSLSGPSSVWLSGGYDSTAIFGAGEAVLARRGDGEHLRAVSVSYPPGDSGREDELISAVVGRFGSPIRWIDIQHVPFWSGPAERARDRGEPFAHAFEMWNRALAAGSRDMQSRVALIGYGGDALFKVSPVYLADLLRSGRWPSLVQEWRASRLHGFRSFFRWAIQPSLPPALFSVAEVLRGRELNRYLERKPPEWISRDFVREHRLLERERDHAPSRGRRRHADYELVWYLEHAYAAQVYSTLCSLTLEAGVELRSPMMDQRIIAFALSRPYSDRSSGGETKRLLRRAMEGSLPDAVLAPRPHKTGTTGTYFDRGMRAEGAEFMRETFRSPLLEELGLVDGSSLRRHSSEYLATGRLDYGLPLFLTLQTELWLRGHLNEPGAHVPGGQIADLVLAR